MIGLDTNILVRFFIGDNVAQANKVYKIFKKAERENAELYVSTLVIVELIWVLEAVYKFERTEVLQTLTDLTSMPIFKFENISAIQSCISDAKTTTFDLSDLLIVYCAKVAGVQPMLTFDKQAAKHKLFELVL